MYYQCVWPYRPCKRRESTPSNCTYNHGEEKLRQVRDRELAGGCVRAETESNREGGRQKRTAEEPANESHIFKLFGVCLCNLTFFLLLLEIGGIRVLGFFK